MKPTYDERLQKSEDGEKYNTYLKVSIDQFPKGSVRSNYFYKDSMTLWYDYELQDEQNKCNEGYA